MIHLLFLTACGEKEPDVPVIPEPSASDLPCDIEVDSDCDGSYNDVDCDPNDGLVYPGARKSHMMEKIMIVLAMVI